MRPPIFSALPLLKTAHLRSLLVRIGANTSGTKQSLVSRLESELRMPELGRARILSIDMGIKNLAFCVCDVKARAGTDKRQPSPHVRRDGSEFMVHAWRHISLLSPPVPVSKRKTATRDDHETISETPSAATTAATAASVNADLYHPAKLSQVAQQFVANTLLSYQPDVILIERQRFRSGGQSAVQEWTLRVNMLEAMLWACLQCLKPDSLGVHSVSPKQVASYWIRAGGEQGDRPEARGKAKVEKKEKVDLVRKWVTTPEAPGTLDPRLPGRLSFGPQAVGARQSFERGTGRNRKGKQETRLSAEHAAEVAGVPQTAKLDDLADCLLQAAAWAQWEQNKRVMVEAEVHDEAGVVDLLHNLG